MLRPYNRDAKIRLLDVRTVSERTGLPYETALAFVRTNGVKVGRRYFITEESLIEALNRRKNE
jgi:hypothetical protein